ncbi:MAG: xanthine dehydrogenase family protein subunit M [Chloroflexi bacterium]|nr:xanthine dehydrogenase family protein subunit M [Chloroflexota bacterium]
MEFIQATSSEQALKTLAEYGEDCAIVSGGTDLVVSLRRELIRPKVILDISRIGALRGIERRDSSLTLSATLTMTDLCYTEAIRRSAPLLAEAAATVGSPLIRNRATLGGNIVTASPAGDTLPALLVHNANVRLCSLSGSREIALREFLRGPKRTDRRPVELLTAVILPLLGDGWGSRFVKLGQRSALAIAIASAAVAVKIKSHIIAEIRIALGSVAPVPLRACRTENWAIGKPLEKESIEKIAQMAATEASPISDVRASAEYRRRVTSALVEEALREAVNRLLRK